MKRILKVIGIVLGVLVGIVIVAAVAINFIADGMMSRTYSVKPLPLVIPTDADSIKEGSRLVQLRGCAGCHAADLGGDPAFLDSGLGKMSTPNITRGTGSRVAGYSDEDLVRAVRHGVAKDGRGLIIMPSYEFYPLSDADLGKILAYVKNAPSVNRVSEVRQFSFVAKALLATGQIPAQALFSASRIPHTQKPPEAPPVGPTVEYGRYVAPACSGCHNENYSGGPGPDYEAGNPIPANLTKVSKKYSEAQFIEFIRTGKAADGTAIDGKFMPWPLYSKSATDTELKALLAFYKSLPERETGK